ncbi:hypothetical protein BGAL_0202g00080 [Botrytis galanthina]|uniref:Uncharacterized protein n=1 Tax=Botrytis galanthina TaxID=278940 RepID=A0A4S8R552_9HELO|nr:hypothetical protein BGAL_0202g00080 [Botrytis galanthina]
MTDNRPITHPCHDDVVSVRLREPTVGDEILVDPVARIGGVPEVVWAIVRADGGVGSGLSGYPARVAACARSYECYGRVGGGETAGDEIHVSGYVPVN